MILCLILLILFHFGRGYHSGCETGVCKIITNCESSFKNIKAIRPEDLCGFSGKTPWVCCSDSLPVRKTTTTQIPKLRTSEIVCASLIPTFDGKLLDLRVKKRQVQFPLTLAPENVTVKPLIVNGINSAPFTRPWMAFVEARVGITSKWSICGGSLISTRHVLTAAHCFKESTLDPRDVVIHMGSVEIDSAIRHEVDKIILHPDYLEPAGYNDIAIVRLLKEVTFKPSIRPICLPPPPTRNNKLRSGQVTVSGWGRLEFKGKLSNVLQEVNLQVVDNKRCNETFLRIRNAHIPFPLGITDNLICAGSDEPKDACGGDSGGPLFIPDRVAKHWTIVGIVSLGYKCAVPGIPGIYTRVSEYLDWITQNLN